MRRLATVITAFVLLCNAASPARELTAEERAQIFGKPESVTASRKVARIRLEGTDHRGYYRCPYMRVWINGHGPYTFLFDTGASYTSLTTKVITSAQLPIAGDRGGYHDVIRLEDMRIGDVHIHNLVAVRDDDFGVDGVLGFRAFGDMNLLFDLRAHTLSVSDRPFELRGSFELPYVLDHTLPTIPVTIGTQDVAMLIDTGDDAYAFETRSSDLKGAAFAHDPLPAGDVRNGANLQHTYVTTLASPVRIGPIAIEHAAVGVNDSLPVPDFGVGFLEMFRFAFNPKRSTVAFQPVMPAAAMAIRGNLSPGFTVRTDEQRTVSDVVPGSPAETEGMRAGDRVVSVDGVAMRDITPARWDNLLATRKSVTVRWIHEANEHTSTLPVRELR
jgi:hypothetical protein